MPHYRVGCMGWGYEDWCGPFYPAKAAPIEFLGRYSRVFDLAEVDSSFYRAPSPFLARRWATSTPPGFTFSLKVPREVTHAPPTEPVETGIQKFLSGIAPLREAGKLGPLVAQFPPSFKRPSGAPRLQAILDGIPTEYSLAVEFRHASWWEPSVLKTLEARGAALVWSVYPTVRPPYAVTGPFLYARFVGDRELTEFGRIQRDLSDEVTAMRRHFEEEGRSVGEAFVLFNNHFMGYGPGTARRAQELLDVTPSDLSLAGRDPGQQRLGEPG
ncbi:MAG: DUF72 domain-containing protein [Thermoplasmata archaeon]|nr:DUF72 domain-containing protein [Thermoplasmata archaeon]